MESFPQKPKIFNDISTTNEYNDRFYGELCVYATHMDFKTENYTQRFYFESISSIGYVEASENTCELSRNGIFINYYGENDGVSNEGDADPTTKYCFYHENSENSIFFLTNQLKIFTINSISFLILFMKTIL
ncbi:hypothetical protein HZS_7451 [Henneguya salminicola]|nr:hypothetical protein HZS_7451 [Henneguya salminicola]